MLNHNKPMGALVRIIILLAIVCAIIFGGLVNACAQASPLTKGRVINVTDFFEDNHTFKFTEIIDYSFKADTDEDAIEKTCLSNGQSTIKQLLGRNVESLTWKISDVAKHSVELTATTWKYGNEYDAITVHLYQGAVDEITFISKRGNRVTEKSYK